MEAEDVHAAKRTAILTESLGASNTRGWGYFGVPGSLSIGDNSYAPKLTRKPPAEDDVGPGGNITTCPVKKGAGVDVYFSFETPLSGEYVEPHLAQRSGRVTMLGEEAFKPPGAVKKSTNKLGYEYMDHCDSAKDPKEVREKYRDYMPPRQILTNPAKKGGGGTLTNGVLFGVGEERKFPEHMPDEYDAPKLLRQKELEAHRSKLLEGAPFRANVYGNRQFADNTETFQYDIPTHVPRDKVAQDTSKRRQHEAPFRPSNPNKKGVLYGTIGGVPEYLEDPIVSGATRRAPVGDAPPPYKISNPRSVTNPMPSIVTNMRNMRNERPASFSRPRL